MVEPCLSSAAERIAAVVEAEVALAASFVFFRAMVLPFEFLPSPCMFFAFANFASRD